MHDALEDVCDRLLRSDTAVPDAGGTPATVIITVDLQDLLNRTGYAVAGDGTLIRTDQALAVAGQADIYVAAMSGGGVPLRLGRTRRIASLGQTAALIARDHGCSFPGCDTAPEWCRTAPHPPLVRRRPHRPGQSDFAVSVPPPQLRQPRLGLSDQPRRTARMATTRMGRPTTPTDDQQPHPRRPRRRVCSTAVATRPELVESPSTGSGRIDRLSAHRGCPSIGHRNRSGPPPSPA